MFDNMVMSSSKILMTWASLRDGRVILSKWTKIKLYDIKAQKHMVWSSIFSSHSITGVHGGIIVFVASGHSETTK